ncbi:MAG: glycosyltransferase, partial [Proteobacteria bacterium]|nr:glycosyltransferase [Pseudomonadota bacterium]
MANDLVRPRICMVVQRYGDDFAGGAESLARRIAEGMNDLWDLEVYSTCAKDYQSWRNEYLPGESTLNGVKIHRFPVEKERNLEEFSKVPYDPQNISKEEENRFFEEQGPNCPSMIEAIAKNKENFDHFIFVTYLYYTTVFGLPKVSEKAFLLSTAHDEKPFYFRRTFSGLFSSLKGLIYLSKAELRLIEREYSLKSDVKLIQAGYGVESPRAIVLSEEKELALKYSTLLEQGYFLFLGRASVSKLCHELFEGFSRFKQISDSNVKLVLAGSLDIDLPKDLQDNIEYVGFLSDVEKSFLLQNSIALINPSATESLSIVIQESWVNGRPVIVNARSETMKEFCEESGAGLWYYTLDSMVAAFQICLQSERELADMGQLGREYVLNRCTWSAYRQSLYE